MGGMRGPCWSECSAEHPRRRLETPRMGVPGQTWDDPGLGFLQILVGLKGPETPLPGKGFWLSGGSTPAYHKYQAGAPRPVLQDLQRRQDSYHPLRGQTH